MDSKELLEKAKKAYYNVQHKEYENRSFIAGYLIGYAEQLRQHFVSGSLPMPELCENCEDVEFCSKECYCLKDCRQ